MRLSSNPANYLVPLLSTLEKWDYSFSTARGTSPSATYVSAFDGVRQQVLEASQQLLRTGYDEVRPVGSMLEQRARNLSAVTTELWGMNARRSTFGPGWERVLDQTISDVRYGLQLLGGSPYPQPDPYPQPTPNPYPGNPYPGNPYPGNPYPGNPYPGNPFPGNETPIPGDAIR